MTTRSCIHLVIATMLLAPFSLAGASTYHLANSYKFAAARGGGEYFDLLTFDAGSDRVYLTHGNEVLVVNASTGKEEGKISGLEKSHGIEVVRDLGRGFISDGAGKVIIFDLKTLKVLGEADAAPNADCIIYDSASKHLFTFNGDSKTASVIDPETGKNVGTLQLGGVPESAVADGEGTIYDNVEETSEVLAIDSRTLQPKSRWPVAPAGAPAPIAMDREHRRLFVAGREPAMLVIMSADDGKVIQSFPITDGADAAVFDPRRSLVLVSTRDGWVHIFHEDSPDHFSVAGKVKTEYGAKTMAYDPARGHIFVVTAQFRKTPKPTKQDPKPRPTPIPGTFHLLVYAP
jgi:hypothetical protein